jgi:hypothetical protein
MKLFFDTEFTGLRKDTTLVSIGIISEDNKTFYAELTDYNKDHIDTWLKQNVIDNLLYSEPPQGEENHYSMQRHSDNPIGNRIDKSYSLEVRCSKDELKEHLTQWLSQFDKVEMWSDCLAYDWVLFCDIFGHAFNVPENVLYIPFDICSLFKLNDIDPDISREKFVGIVNSKGQNETNEFLQKHNALFDAKVIKKCYELLTLK